MQVTINDRCVSLFVKQIGISYGTNFVDVFVTIGAVRTLHYKPNASFSSTLVEHGHLLCLLSLLANSQS